MPIALLLFNLAFGSLPTLFLVIDDSFYSSACTHPVVVSSSMALCRWLDPQNQPKPNIPCTYMAVPLVVTGNVALHGGGARDDATGELGNQGGSKRGAWWSCLNVPLVPFLLRGSHDARSPTRRHKCRQRA